MILIDTVIDTITANYMASNSNDIPYGLTLAQKHDLDWHQATEIRLKYTHAWQHSLVKRPILVYAKLKKCWQRLAARASALGAAGTPGSTLLSHPNLETLLANRCQHNMTKP
jgi:hypothetical protein